MMKRASILGALALVAGFLFAAPAANAQVVPSNPGGCTLVNNSLIWPTEGHHYDCGDQAALSVNTYALPNHIKAKFANQNVWVFLWKSPIQYDTYRQQLVAAGVIPSHTPVAGTYRLYGVTGNKQVGVIDINVFERVRGHDTCTEAQYCVIDQTDLTNSFVHEIGHAIDFVYGEPSLKTNAGAAWNVAVANAFTYMNGLSSATVYPHGIPPKKIVGPGPAGWVAYVIPPGPSTVANKRNEKIAKELMPYYFDGSVVSRKEFFANAFAQYRGNLAGFDWANPYGSKYKLVLPHPNGANLLSEEELFKRLREVVKFGGAAPVSFMHKIWTDPAFAP